MLSIYLICDTKGFIENGFIMIYRTYFQYKWISLIYRVSANDMM